MTFSRASTGAVLGIVIALVWKTLGAEVVLWSLILGAAGAVVGYFLDHPGKLIAYLKRLER